MDLNPTHPQGPLQSGTTPLNIGVTPARPRASETALDTAADAAVPTGTSRCTGRSAGPRPHGRVNAAGTNRHAAAAEASSPAAAAQESPGAAASAETAPLDNTNHSASTAHYADRSADPSADRSADRSADDSAAGQRRLERNRRWLRARDACRDAAERLAWRNTLVAGNMGLVRSIAARESRGSDLPFEDLVQVGCLGLIRALEAFDPSRGHCLSTFAVPYIRGAIRREYRDRRAMVRIPRPLWELRQRACRLQDQRLRAGEPELGLQALAETLGCGLEALAEALGLETHSRVWSLDAPRPGGQGDGGEGSSWLEQLADPASLARPDELVRPADGGLLRWLQRRLGSLSPAERLLVEGRIGQNRTWVDLGHELGLPARQAQRRCHALLTRLRQEAESCLQSQGLTARASSAASSV